MAYCHQCGKYMDYVTTTPYTLCLTCQQLKFDFPNNATTNAYNYKCPDCNGEFIYPAQKHTGKTEDVAVTEIGTPGIVNYQKTWIYQSSCPFCGRIMEGL